MNNHTEQQNQTTSLLNEIFLASSNEIKTERFSSENQASSADCSGKCTGICHGRG